MYVCIYIYTHISVCVCHHMSWAWVGFPSECPLLNNPHLKHTTQWPLGTMDMKFCRTNCRIENVYGCGSFRIADECT